MEKSLDYNPKHSGQVYLLSIVFLFLVQLIFSIIGASNKELFTNTLFLTVYRICLAGVTLAIFFFYNRSQGVSNYACGIKNKTNPWNILICILCVVGFVLLTSPFISWIDYFISLTGISVDASIGFALDNFWNVLLVVILMCLLPAITEEIIFRGMILNGLRRLGRWPAVILSALAFCLMHANLPQFPYTFLLGMLLGLVMYETRCLWLSMIMHFINNLVVIIAMVIGGTSSDIQAEAFATPIWLAILMFIIGLMIAFLCFILVRKLHLKKEKTTSQTISTKEQTEKRTIFDWGFLIAGFFVAVLLTLLNTFG